MSDDSGDEYEQIDLDDSGLATSFSLPSSLSSFLGLRAGPVPSKVPGPSPKTPGSPRSLLKHPPPLPPPNVIRKFGPQGQSPKVAQRKPAPPTRNKPRRSHTISGSGHGKAPPPPPPVRADSSSSMIEKAAQTRLKKSQEDYVTCSDELTLAQFVNKHQQEFPLRVRVCKGFYGSSEKTSVSEGDSFNIHFVKNSKVVTMGDGHGEDYKIPINSAVEFGILYNPLHNKVEACKGFFYDKVSDLLALQTLPKIVRATESFRGSSPETGVDANELLAIRGIKKGVKGRSLKVLSLQTKKKKELAENCKGCFSTRPYEVRLYLPEIVEFLRDPLPVEAMLFANAETAEELPSTMVSSVVTLKGLSVETSLIATGTVVEDCSSDIKLIEIPFDLDIEVQITRPKDDDETEQLYEDTRTLLEAFDPKNVCAYFNTANSSAFSARNVFFNNVREGNELTGVDLVKPAALFIEDTTAQGIPSPASAPGTPTATRALPAPPLPNASPLSPLQSQIQSQGPMEAILMSLGQFEVRLQKLEASAKRQEKSEVLEELEANVTRLSRDLMSSRSDSMRTEGRVVKATEGLNTLAPKMESLQTLCETMQGELKALQEKVSMVTVSPHVPATAMNGSVHPPTSPSTNIPPPTTNEATMKQNREYLTSLDCNQMIQLLESMGLKQYTSSFVKERITGEILMECDDEVLAQELKITSKLHRVRLLKLMSGRHSAENVLRGEDPYVYATMAL